MLQNYRLSALTELRELGLFRQEKKTLWEDLRAAFLVYKGGLKQI